MIVNVVYILSIPECRNPRKTSRKHLPYLVEVKEPEDGTKVYQASYPLTELDDLTQTLSADKEQSIAEKMREMLPHFADHPFAKTKFCWYV